MPVLYTAPDITITDGQVASRGSTTGILADITSVNPYLGYETRATGQLNFTCAFTDGVARAIDSVHVIASNVSHVALNNVTPSAQELQSTFNDRMALVYTNDSATTSGTSFTVSLTKASANDPVTVYSIKVMRRVLNLATISDERTITTYSPSTTDRSIDVVVDIYGDSVQQRRHGSRLRTTTRYTIWHAMDNLSTCRQEFNTLKRVYYQNKSFNILDLNEVGAVDYESCYRAHWVNDSISLNIEGPRVISYSFTVTEE